MQKHTNLQIKFTIRWLNILLMLGVLAGCNLGSSTSEKQVSSLLAEPMVRISAIQSNNALTARGEYHDRDEITVTLEAKGSLNSSVTCSVSLQYLSSGSYTDDPSGPVAACNDIHLALSSGAGVYRLLAKVTDGNSKTAESRRFLIATSQSITDRPYLQASFTPTVSTNISNAYEIQLDATGSTAGETGDIVSYTWQIRLKQNNSGTTVDTFTEYGPKTSVVLNNDGIYVVKLTVTDAGGKTSSMTKQFSVGLNSSVVVTFTFSTTSASPTAPLNLNVDESGSTISAGVDHYIWQVYKSDALDAVIYEIQTESATTTLPLIDPGTYLIKLKVIDKTGNEHDYSQLVSV